MTKRTPEGKPPEVQVSAPDDEKAKGRSFAATLFAWVEADGLWEGGGTETENRRPIYAVFGTDEGSAPYFKANLRLGRRVEVPDGETGNRFDKEKSAERWEFLKSGGYRIDEQRHPGVGVLLEVRLTRLLRIDGDGMVDPKEASFVMLPTRAWAEAQQIDERAVLQHLRAIGCLRSLGGKVSDETLVKYMPCMAATGALFAAYLDRRTRCPLPADPRLYAQIMVAAVDKGMAGISVKKTTYETPWGYAPGLFYSEHGLDRVGLLPGMAFRSTHDKLEPFLAAEVSRFLRRTTTSNGTRPPRRAMANGASPQ